MPVSPSKAYGDGIDLLVAFRKRFSLPGILVTGHPVDSAQAELEKRGITPAPVVLGKPVEAVARAATENTERLFRLR